MGFFTIIFKRLKMHIFRFQTGIMHALETILIKRTLMPSNLMLWCPPAQFPSLKQWNKDALFINLSRLGNWMAWFKSISASHIIKYSQQS